MGKLKCNLVKYINQYFQFKLKVKLLFCPSTGIFLESLLPAEKRLEEAPSSRFIKLLTPSLAAVNSHRLPSSGPWG